ncbi:effector binding domain-containing protein [Ureibacillus sp. GCM10028918]|uniref:effector binding domain-containing protein n=1 Tax=Ureibacillus sp. GCM10028918 TaxID=3273429 RepID=UPI00361405C9
MKLTIIKSSRTNNFNDEHMLQKISDLWKDASDTLVKHENNIYGIYHNYESNYKGDYSLSIAIENNGEEPAIVISDSGKYEIFSVDKDDQQGVFNTWSKIWGQEETGSLKRAYSYDFEKYYPNGDIEIYIAVK